MIARAAIDGDMIARAAINGDIIARAAIGGEMIARAAIDGDIKRYDRADARSRARDSPNSIAVLMFRWLFSR